MTRYFVIEGIVGAAMLWLAATAPGNAEPCGALSYDGAAYTVCTVDIRRDRLALFERDAAGHPLATFDRLAAGLAHTRRHLVFAMNAGMFEPDLSPVGLLIEGGEVRHAVNTSNGEGNFYLKPNGVFFFGPDGVGVKETGAFLDAHLHPDFATQSGPMLVIDGKLHPRIQKDGTSLKIRNGVGVRDARRAVFVISDTPVSFFQFASLFRDRLGCRDALYLDGHISALYAPTLGLTHQIAPLGPMVGVTSPEP